MFWYSYRMQWKTVVLAEWKMSIFLTYAIFIFLPLSLNSLTDITVRYLFIFEYCLCVYTFLTALYNFKCPLTFYLHIISKVTWYSQCRTLESWPKVPKFRFYPWPVFGPIFLLQLELSPLLIWEGTPPLTTIYDWEWQNLSCGYSTPETDSLPMTRWPAHVIYIFIHIYNEMQYPTLMPVNQ
jgi:hypothetical protein